MCTFLATALFAPACVVTGAPSYEPPTRRPPRLTEVTPTDEFITITNSNLTVQFQADLQSFDAGDDIQAVLLRNYGIPRDNQTFFRLEDVLPTVSPSNDADERRRLTMVYDALPLTGALLHTCWRLTMVVSHELYTTEFERALQHCPVDADDVDRLTWYVMQCDVVENCDLADCEALRPEEGFLTCEDQERIVLGAIQ